METKKKRSIVDKNLKKLSRVELLELMVSLSEDYEALADENNRLKKMLSQQRLPRSTKVGSIAEAALQANGYFEAVQRSADDYLREIKHLRDELAKRADAQTLNKELAESVEAARVAESHAQAYLKDAQAQASQAIARANAQAEAIVADARARAEQVIANANRQSHSMMSQAQRRAVQAEEERAHDAQLVERQERLLQQQLQQPRLRRQSQVDELISSQPAAQISSATTGELLSRGRHSRIAAQGGV